jgi:uncharacterized protein YbcV (DUF1398 family)
MFTINQIKAIHSKVKSGADFPAYVQELKELGLTHYDMFVKNGQGIYYGANGFKISGNAAYPEKIVLETPSKEKLLHALTIHQQCQTNYLTFCEQAANAGVEKWATYVVGGEVIYYDKQGNEMVTEAIPTA